MRGRFFSSALVNRRRVQAKQRQSGRAPDLLYFARKLENDDFIREFVVIGGAKDPGMFVESETADGTRQRWLRFEEDGRSVFVAPDGYLGGPIAWVHDKSLTAQSLVYESPKTTVDFGGKR